ncbi:hypothetical protein DL240_15370 [Lujinxingia litoralis]|uniref:OmpA-like domain-containing protein n=1 Tax=Lujinxingia litoralis TaxID=2211119 RepID=A0A328C5V3_9DELT|nr:OmpA family protein [Lujinxingia litoralis]RAL20696.1 hypothetical protein DL240_15370 [Lujinxingia litoralis]
MNILIPNLRSLPSLLTRAGLTTLIAALLCAAPAAAQDFEYRVNNRVQVGQGHPSLTLRAPATLTDVVVTFQRSDGHTRTQRLGRLERGEVKELRIEQPPGTFDYTLTLKGTDTLGEPVEFQLTFDVAFTEPLRVNVDTEQIELGQGRLPIQVNRPVDKVEIELFDQNNRSLGTQTSRLNGQRGNLSLTFQPPSAQLAGVRVTVHDTDGFWESFILEPFWVEIPHQSVVFDSGQHSWQDSELPKLTETLERVQQAMRAHRDKGLQMQLYIAGYTDTVGDAASNQRLSERRARAIGQWFASQNLDIPIFYQGFGEAVLAKPTPDNTPEEANRRALYILGNGTPPTSDQLPASRWNRVR